MRADSGQATVTARAGRAMGAAAGVVAVVWFLGSIAGRDLGARHGLGLRLPGRPANFDIPFQLIDWSIGDTYARALLVCVLNTLLVSAMSIVAATLLGLLVGIMRLSTNWLVRNIALGFIELVRNTPQLVQIIFWYIAVLQTLPGPRQSILLPGGVLLNIRGLYLPSFIGNDWAGTLWPLALVAGACRAVRLARAAGAACRSA